MPRRGRHTTKARIATSPTRAGRPEKTANEKRSLPPTAYQRPMRSLSAYHKSLHAIPFDVALDAELAAERASKAAASTSAASTNPQEECPLPESPPASTDEEAMDQTSTCKRDRDSDDDEGEDNPSKQFASVMPAPASLEVVPATSTCANVPTTTADTNPPPPQPSTPSPGDDAATQVREAAPVPTRKTGPQRKRHNTKRSRKQQPRVAKQVTEKPPLLPPSSPLAEDDFRVVLSKAARRRARALEAAILPPNPAVTGTVLFRPATPGGNFRGSSRLALAAALSARPGVTAVRVNHRRNIVAADASSAECLEELLSITELTGIPVAAGKPSDRRSSTGIVYGVDGDLSDAELLAATTASAPVLCAAREDRTVKFRFSGTTPPECVYIHKVPFRVRPVRPRPVQCLQCGRYGHVIATCPRPEDCIRCGRKHPASSACTPRCVNCGGSHPASTPTCPRWQEERRVATIIASASTPVSRRAVRAAVREEIQLQSYAAALKNGPSSKTAPDCARPIPAPRRSLALPASHAPTASPAVPPPAAPLATPMERARKTRAQNKPAPALQPSATSSTSPVLPDPLAAHSTTTADGVKDGLIVQLLALLRTLAVFIPADHPQRATLLAQTDALCSAVPIV